MGFQNFTDGQILFAGSLNRNIGQSIGRSAQAILEAGSQINNYRGDSLMGIGMNISGIDTTEVSGNSTAVIFDILPTSVPQFAYFGNLYDSYSDAAVDTTRWTGASGGANIESSGTTGPLLGNRGYVERSGINIDSMIFGTTTTWESGLNFSGTNVDAKFYAIAKMRGSGTDGATGTIAFFLYDNNENRVRICGGSGKGVTIAGSFYRQLFSLTIQNGSLFYSGVANTFTVGTNIWDEAGNGTVINLGGSLTGSIWYLKSIITTAPITLDGRIRYNRIYYHNNTTATGSGNLIISGTELIGTRGMAVGHAIYGGYRTNPTIPITLRASSNNGTNFYAGSPDMPVTLTNSGTQCLFNVEFGAGSSPQIPVIAKFGTFFLE